MVMLTESEKMIVLAAGIGAVALAVVVVACIVAPICPLHRLLPQQARIRLTPIVKRKTKGRKANGDVNGNAQGELTQLRVTSYISYGNDLHEHEVVESNMSPQQQSGHQHVPVTTSSPPDSLNFKPADKQRRPTILSTRDSTVDSNYSSMTPTGSRPSSPVSFKSDAPDVLSSLDSTSVKSADNSPLYGSVTVSVQLSTTEDPALVRILVGIQEAQDLPARDGISCGDPFFRVSIVKESRAFRRSKTRSNVLAEFQTSAQKKTRHPIYNQKFAKEILKTDFKDCVIKFAAFDKDKYANPTEFGEAALTLKNLTLSLQGQPIQFCLELSEPKQNNGELQLSLMYLPTAERLAFNLFRVSHLRIDNSKGEAENSAQRQDGDQEEDERSRSVRRTSNLRRVHRLRRANRADAESVFHRGRRDHTEGFDGQFGGRGERLVAGRLVLILRRSRAVHRQSGDRLESAVHGTSTLGAGTAASSRAGRAMAHPSLMTVPRTHLGFPIPVLDLQEYRHRVIVQKCYNTLLQPKVRT